MESRPYDRSGGGDCLIGGRAGLRSMTTRRQRDLVDRYIAAYNAFDVEGLLELLHPAVVFRNVSGGQITATATGIQEFRQLAEQSKETFSSRIQEVTSFATEGETVEVNIRYRATLARDLHNGMKAGETLCLEGRSVFRLRDGKFDRITDYS